MSTDSAERSLGTALVDGLLREDFGTLSHYVLSAGRGPALRLPGRDVVLPLEPDGFLASLRVRRPAPAVGLDGVLRALESIADPRDREGTAALAAECRQALATLRLRERQPPAVRARLAALAEHDRTEDGTWLGPGGLRGYEALAAALPHPAYPTSACRLGFADEDTLRYAPEYLPGFTLSWVAVPRTAVIAAADGQPPPWWPAPADVGLPESLAATHVLLPVHPLTARRELDRALAELGLADAAAVAPDTYLRVTPTLSTRTVTVRADPHWQVKLPLPTSTLGLRNRRSIVPRTLADGALVSGLLAKIAADAGGWDDLLAADERDYAHAGHPFLGYLLRRLSPGLEQCRVVPIAALLAPAAEETGQDRPLVIEELAATYYGGDLTGLFTEYLDTLFGVHVRLFAEYGIALEAHQQNAALVLGGPNSAGGPRLLVKDFDGTLVNHARLAAALGTSAPAPAAFADERMLTTSDDALADVFVTITVHLCAGALAFGLADRGVAPLPPLLATIRQALDRALRRYPGSAAAALLRARTLDADLLPVKSMLTAGTLLSKERSGASDINKHYDMTGPNYLRGDIR
jgi:siderophore synthetase component